MDFAGPFLLIVMTPRLDIEIVPLASYEDCRAVQVQMEPLPVETVCIAATLTQEPRE